MHKFYSVLELCFYWVGFFLSRSIPRYQESATYLFFRQNYFEFIEWVFETVSQRVLLGLIDLVSDSILTDMNNYSENFLQQLIELFSVTRIVI